MLRQRRRSERRPRRRPVSEYRRFQKVNGTHRPALGEQEQYTNPKWRSPQSPVRAGEDGTWIISGKGLTVQGDPRPQLRERTAQIMALRGEGFLLWEIADQVGVTKERVRQILSTARAMGQEPKPLKQVVTRQASILLGMSPEMRQGSFVKLMAKFGVSPIATKRGRLYWAVESLRKIEPPKCAVCQSPIPLGRYARSVTCSRACSVHRRSQYASHRRTRASNGSDS